jgi:hypothetical protein
VEEVDRGLARERFAICVVPAGPLKRSLGTLVLGALGDFSEAAGSWTGEVVEVRDRKSEKVVVDSRGAGDPKQFAIELQNQLDNLSIEEFCAQWSIDCGDFEG